MIKLRPHHLFCLKFYRGYAYSYQMKSRLDQLISRLSSGEDIEIILGPDDVCSSCPYLHGDNCTKSHRIRFLDELAMKLLKPRTQLSWLKLDEELIQQWFRVACEDCDWISICKSSSKLALE